MAGRLAMVLLFAIHLVGIKAMYGLLLQNGYYDALLQLRDQKPPRHLPGSANPLLTRYCGIGPVDKLLTLASIMFANVTDGSYPTLSVYAIHFAAQYLGVLTLLMVESLRAGNQGSFSMRW